jgi:hypothetical protein
MEVVSFKRAGAFIDEAEVPGTTLVGLTSVLCGCMRELEREPEALLFCASASET